jgi:hypothetical protein
VAAAFASEQGRIKGKALTPPLTQVELKEVRVNATSSSLLAHEPPKAVEQSRRTKANGGSQERDEDEIKRCATLASLRMNVAPSPERPLARAPARLSITGAKTGAHPICHPYDPCLGAAGPGGPTGLQNQSGVAAPRLLGSTPGSLRPHPTPAHAPIRRMDAHEAVIRSAGSLPVRHTSFTGACNECRCTDGLNAAEGE